MMLDCFFGEAPHSASGGGVMTRVRNHAIAIAVICCLGVNIDKAAAAPAPAPADTAIDQVLKVLNDSVAGLKRDIAALHNAIAPGPGPAPAAVFTLSSGLFGLPAAARSVDWMVVNNTTVSQTFTITVFRAGVGAKTVVP